MAKRLTGFILFFAVLFSVLSGATYADSVSDNVLCIAERIITWKKQDVIAEPDGFLINDTFLELAGTTPGDWYPIGLGRLGISDNYEGYLAVIRDQVEKRYCQPGKLSAAKATEWHRIALAVLASGGDPTNIGTDEKGQPIDLIADGTYDRGKTTPLGRQGINGWIWGLIALDSMRYEIPEDAFYTRDDIIVEILRQQLPDGGFALSGTISDTDITAMAVQALAPYYNSEEQYTYQRKPTDTEVTKTVRAAVEEAIDCLSEKQLPTGDFESWRTQNVESTDQVVVALCALGIDPLTDERFIKNGNTLLDGILRYQMPDGGFVHSFTYDPDNPTSLPDKSNTMASEQTLYTMAAIWRQRSGMRTLYDFRPEQSSALKQRIADLETQIAATVDLIDAEKLEELLTAFYSIPENERNYADGYWKLSEAAKKAGLDVERIAGETVVVESPEDDLGDTVAIYFSDADRRSADSLPEKLTTEQYVQVTTLVDKLRQCEDFDEKELYLQKLISAEEAIKAVQDEIDALNTEITEKLYPFENISLKDKKTVDGIVLRYEALSEYDRSKIIRWEDVIKTKTQIDNILRGIVIAIVLCIFTVFIAFFLVRRIHKKRRKRELEMEQLAALYEDEDE